MDAENNEEEEEAETEGVRDREDEEDGVEIALEQAIAIAVSCKNNPWGGEIERKRETARAVAVRKSLAVSHSALVAGPGKESVKQIDAGTHVRVTQALG